MDRAGENRFARLRPPIGARLWRQAVGARIAERALPLALTGDVLLLRVATSVWAHELSLLSDEVCERLRERGIAVRKLRFQVGAVPGVDRPPERRTSRAVPRSGARRELPRELAAALDRMNDDGLRDAIALAASANLAWQELARPAPPTDVSEARRGAQAPRSAGVESAPPAQGSPASREAWTNSREAERRRPR